MLIKCQSSPKLGKISPLSPNSRHVFLWGKRTTGALQVRCHKTQFKKPFTCPKCTRDGLLAQCTPGWNSPPDQKLVFRKLVSFETQNIDVEQKHNLKSGKIKDEKGFEWQHKTGNPKKEKGLMKTKCVVEYFDVVPFMKQKAKNKEKERKRQKQGTKKKQKRKTRRTKKSKEQARDREREIEKVGGQKWLRINKGRHSKINKKCPFLVGKNSFSTRCKDRKQKNK